MLLQQKVVIRVAMVDQKKSRVKAMKIAATAFGKLIPGTINDKPLPLCYFIDSRILKTKIMLMMQGCSQ